MQVVPSICGDNAEPLEVSLVMEVAFHLLLHTATYHQDCFLSEKQAGLLCWMDAYKFLTDVERNQQSLNIRGAHRLLLLLRLAEIPGANHEMIEVEVSE